MSSCYYNFCCGNCNSRYCCLKFSEQLNQSKCFDRCVYTENGNLTFCTSKAPYCCGSCNNRTCCAEKNNRLDQGKCTNQIKTTTVYKNSSIEKNSWLYYALVLFFVVVIFTLLAKICKCKNINKNRRQTVVNSRVATNIQSSIYTTHTEGNCILI